MFDQTQHSALARHPRSVTSITMAGAVTIVVLAINVSLAGVTCARAQESPSTPATETTATAKTGAAFDFESLATLDGKIYRQAIVRKVEPDSLLVEHAGGLARVSLFDLTEEIQQRYHFDHDQAMAHYKQREAEQRALRKQLFFERIRQDAEAEAEARQEALENTVAADWIPVRASIVSLHGDDALARVDRIILRPTRTINAFGSESLPGAPEKHYVPIASVPVVLKGIAAGADQSIFGEFWNGYVWPDGEVALDPNFPEEKTPVYRAMQSRSK